MKYKWTERSNQGWVSPSGVCLTAAMDSTASVSTLHIGEKQKTCFVVAESSDLRSWGPPSCTPSVRADALHMCHVRLFKKGAKGCGCKWMVAHRRVNVTHRGRTGVRFLVPCRTFALLMSIPFLVLLLPFQLFVDLYFTIDS